MTSSPLSSAWLGFNRSQLLAERFGPPARSETPPCAGKSRSAVRGPTHAGCFTDTVIIETAENSDLSERVIASTSPSRRVPATPYCAGNDQRSK